MNRLWERIKGSPVFVGQLLALAIIFGWCRRIWWMATHPAPDSW